MTPPLNAITALLLDDVPNTYCYPCLAFKLQVTEKEARRAAEPMVLLDGFQLRSLRCADCREDDLLQLPETPTSGGRLGEAEGGAENGAWGFGVADRAA